VVALLDREAASDPDALALDDEEAHAYGEYLMELVHLAVQTEDRRAIRPLTRIWIDEWVGVRQFVASHPDLALPALEETWTEHLPLRSDVIATHGEMLRGSRLGHLRLTTAQRRQIELRLIEAAADGQAETRVAFVSLVGRERLVEWLPLVQMLARGEASPVPAGEFAEVMATRALPELEAAARALSITEQLDLLIRLHASICADAVQLRHGQCTSLGVKLQNAARMLGRGMLQPARNNLEGYRDDLGRPAAVSAFSPAERRLLVGNAEVILARW
jgi:hypothetical protein